MSISVSAAFCSYISLRVLLEHIFSLLSKGLDMTRKSCLHWTMTRTTNTPQGDYSDLKTHVNPVSVPNLCRLHKPSPWLRVDEMIHRGFLQVDLSAFWGAAPNAPCFCPAPVDSFTKSREAPIAFYLIKDSSVPFNYFYNRIHYSLDPKHWFSLF
jgi:hypothetical protein